MIVTIYGAITRQQPKKVSTNLIRKYKRIFHELRDRVFFAFGSTYFLDYRNYDSSTPSNIGDIAVSTAVSELLKNNEPQLKIIYTDWVSGLSVDENKNYPVVISGGGYFLIDKNGSLPSRLHNDIKYFRETKAKLILFGVGLNNPGQVHKFNSNKIKIKDQSVVKEILSFAQLISVRDEATQTFLQQYTDKKVELIGDPAITLEYYKNENFQKTQPLIGFNLPFHGPATNKILKENLPKYTALLQDLQQKTKCKFIYFVHYDTEHIIPRLLSKNELTFDVVFGDPKYVLSKYNELDLHIGGMLHSCIFSFTAGTPFISLAYDIKHHGFLKLIGLLENNLSAINFDHAQIIKRCIELLNNQVKNRNYIGNKKEHFVKKIKVFSEKCLSEISK